jgi:hypothetical protein
MMMLARYDVAQVYRACEGCVVRVQYLDPAPGVAATAWLWVTDTGVTTLSAADGDLRPIVQGPGVHPVVDVARCELRLRDGTLQLLTPEPKTQLTQRQCALIHNHLN